MPSIQIIITQSGVPGAFNESRSDIITGSVVTLSNDDNDGATHWKWEFINKPSGSSANIVADSDAKMMNQRKSCRRALGLFFGL